MTVTMAKSPIVTVKEANDTISYFQTYFAKTISDQYSFWRIGEKHRRNQRYFGVRKHDDGKVDVKYAKKAIKKAKDTIKDFMDKNIDNRTDNDVVDPNSWNNFIQTLVHKIPRLYFKKVTFSLSARYATYMFLK